MSLIDSARWFASLAHCGQVRKYSADPYVTHCERVAALCDEALAADEVVAAAFLHDTIEDTPTTFDNLVTCFGRKVATLVLEVTEFSVKSDGNRALRKALDRRYLARVSPEAQTIKLADLIDNTSDIVMNDPDFARVYLEEKALLLPLLKYGSPILMKKAAWQLAAGQCALAA